MYPSSAARAHSAGGGYRDLASDRLVRDAELFPAIVLERLVVDELHGIDWNVRVLGPTGVFILPGESYIAVDRADDPI